MSFKINANETVAFVGKSGAGKTTIFNLLCKMYDVDSGSIMIDGVEIKKYNQEEILQFKDDDRFDEAFCFSEESPDVLAVAAIIDDEIVGMAGASADSSSFWQIGINVNKNFEGRHIASGIVSILKADILQKGIVPYYGTSFSNLASQHVAAKAGFEVAWVELITERTEY